MENLNPNGSRIEYGQEYRVTVLNPITEHGGAIYLSGTLLRSQEVMGFAQPMEPVSIWIRNATNSGSQSGASDGIDF